MGLDSLNKHLLPDLARHWRLELNKTEACLQGSEDEEDRTLEGQEPQLYTKHLERTEKIPFSFQPVYLEPKASPILEATDAPIG
ncbi:hypothetical protein D623_10029618 [Myotis brandtii]|uniref:Uncharacterized protein n=1 Tax=Myotis brandtii TaxID=109478 RepID=S7N830_MYOBR|nr:hypothetical protein D623_10029618 [Myotis brandtii]